MSLKEGELRGSKFLFVSSKEGELRGSKLLFLSSKEGELVSTIEQPIILMHGNI